MMVPNNLLINYFKVKNDKKLGPILDANQEFFDPLDNPYGDYNALVLFIMSE